MTAEEVLDMQIEHYKKELIMSAENLQTNITKRWNLGYACSYAEQAARQANMLSSLFEIKFIMSQNHESPKISKAEIIDNQIKNQKIILDYDDDIVKIAQSLACGDKFLAEELRSEMYIAVLNSKLNDKDLDLIGARKKAVEYLDKAYKRVVRNGKIA